MVTRSRESISTGLEQNDVKSLFQECKNKSALQRHYALGHGIMFRSGSPRPLSKPRNTFTLYTTPLSRAVRPLCSIRRLACRPSASIDLSDVRNQWEARLNENSTDEIRSTCVRLRQRYEKGRERYKNIHLSGVFPFAEENSETKTIDDYIPRAEEKESTEEELNIPIRYPKLKDDVSDFFAQFAHPNQSIMKKRPYEPSENSNEGKLHSLVNASIWSFASPVRSIAQANVD